MTQIFMAESMDMTTNTGDASMGSTIKVMK